ncbi:hypothetical protein OJF2_79060 (plasmid) [Aquisphaera giovannonii]|uniref:Uncharacterized protein n=1 Tax=Aquisphaera giovannonii TaxID=406548 RepID=A0A5B9WH86_9BACT|nr:hypothetical protein [Aquisphaera giovannonii]QEH39291.1 hypothetical protein OJF2_79060 [Aquisphaera giovannonii]
MDHFRPQGTPKPSPATGGRIGYQSERISLRGILGFAVILTATIAAAQYVLALMMSHYGEEEARGKQAASPMLATPWEVPGPRLQPDPAAERLDVQAAQKEHLASYGWVDAKAGVAHIPIDRAMDVLAKAGLPDIKPGPATDSPLMPPAEAESQAQSAAPKPAPEVKKAP